jgi:hypothetical protein
MARVFSGSLPVHYSQAYVLTGEMTNPDFFSAFRGQANGLCGAAVRGALWLTTGLHTGRVGFTVDVLDAAPPLDDAWEEIVEVSFTVPGDDEEFEYYDEYRGDEIEITERYVSLLGWGGSGYCDIPISPGSYRVRYCARGMDIGRRRDTLIDDEDLVDFYSLAFWPAEPEPDCVIKQTSEIAAYWHKCAPSYR